MSQCAGPLSPISLNFVKKKNLLNTKYGGSLGAAFAPLHLLWHMPKDNTQSSKDDRKNKEREGASFVQRLCAMPVPDLGGGRPPSRGWVDSGCFRLSPNCRNLRSSQAKPVMEDSGQNWSLANLRESEGNRPLNCKDAPCRSQGEQACTGSVGGRGLIPLSCIPWEAPTPTHPSRVSPDRSSVLA